MNRRSHNLLLVMLVLALAVAPLRGALALSTQSDMDSDVHCAGMQQDMHATPALAAGDQGCKQECDCNCCDSACGICAAGGTALTGTETAAGGFAGAIPAAIVSSTFPVRNLSPPFRPPSLSN